MSNTFSFSYEDFAQRRARFVSIPLTPDIFRWYQEKQRSHAVWFDEQRATWMVFRYADVRNVLLDSHIFSSQRWIGPNGKSDLIVNESFLGMDPPDHRRLRTLVSQAFTPHVIANLEPRITSVVQDLLDQIATKREIDLVDDLAFPLPIAIIAELLGVPSADHEHFRVWSAEIVGIDMDLRMIARKHFIQYFRSMITQRRVAPRDDLISSLLQVEVDGEPLPEEDLVAICILLLVAGHETTTGLISNALVCFDEHPESREALMAQPELMPSAIEEVLRYRAVVNMTLRVALVDTVLAGQEIKAGDLVAPVFASANLDERQFPDARTFHIERTPNRHLGFGHGIHFCLGAPLARLETRIVLQMLFERFPNIQLRRDVPLELRPSNFIYGLKHLPMHY